MSSPNWGQSCALKLDPQLHMCIFENVAPKQTRLNLLATILNFPVSYPVVFIEGYFWTLFRVVLQLLNSWAATNCVAARAACVQSFPTIYLRGCVWEKANNAETFDVELCSI